MSIIEAKCPNCGAPLKLNTNDDASYCEFCKTPFVTEKAIRITGDYIQGNKIVNTIKQDNEHTVNVEKEKSKEYAVMAVVIIITLAFALWMSTLLLTSL